VHLPTVGQRGVLGPQLLQGRDVLVHRRVGVVPVLAADRRRTGSVDDLVVRRGDPSLRLSDGSEVRVDGVVLTVCELPLLVYVPSERMTIAIGVNMAIPDGELEALLQQVYELAVPAFR
jgi:hypothetical protein